jgi:hypothetical protein
VEEVPDNAINSDPALFPTETSKVANFALFWGKCHTLGINQEGGLNERQV